ncbi:MAG: response regulator [Pseudomonadota bacterium]|nr:response regulator [Pseudomonadota bacterium]
MPDHHHHVLLVDDNDDVRETSADMLEELGYRVLQATNGFDALDKLAEYPDLDVMVTDIRMPGMSGFELFDLASARYQTLKVVMMSAYFSPQATKCRLVRKPFRTIDLDNAIREALAN